MKQQRKRWELFQPSQGSLIIELAMSALEHLASLSTVFYYFETQKKQWTRTYSNAHLLLTP